MPTVAVTPPIRPIVCVPWFWALSVMVMVPVSGIAVSALGVHVTVIAQVPCGGIAFSGQLFVAPKSVPAAVMFPIVNPAVPVLVSVIVCGGLIVPGACGPNVKLNGE
jgi:hypothetical protein